ncbi:MAG: hypothetical protein IJW86_03885 [Clostridia bacterium]|nr:hypothetical protein [Clostridia bacterium]
MDTSQDFDFLISKYSEDLMHMKKKWSEWGIVTEEKMKQNEEEPLDSEPSAEAVALTDGEDPTPEDTQQSETPAEAAAPEKDPPESMNDYPSAAPEFYANFQARVFSGDQAYPIEGAKVLIYLGGRLHTFLITNENGETQRVKIESSPDENALTPNSENQQLDYLADIYADGFAEKKGLLVSAVGGSDILLNVQLTPEPERID